MQIRLAHSHELSRVIHLYDIIIDAMQSEEYRAGWQKGIYPTESFLSDAILNGELYVAELNDTFVACMVVNHKGNESYQQVQWLIEAEDAEQLVIHALGVHPEYVRQGIAQKMARFIIALATVTGIKSIRLDVLHNNLPAQRTYEKAGFRYLETTQMYYDDTGWTDFLIYEYVV